MTENKDLLDMDTLNDLRTMLDDGLDELLQEYLSDSQQLVQELIVAAGQGDTEKLISLAHALKGSSGNLGVSHVYHISQALEQDARDGRLEDAPARVSELQQEYQRACDALKPLIHH
jgi:HPt (histidine-containing phosphotransfer) domain-containing protein